MYQSNQKRLFERMENQERTSDEIPEAQESREFYNKIWNVSAVRNDNARWLHGVEDELSNINRQEDINIELQKVRKQLRKMPNCKAPGLDGLPGYWLKNLVGCHEESVGQPQICLDSAQMPEWLTTGRTILIQKDKEKRNVVNN